MAKDRTTDDARARRTGGARDGATGAARDGGTGGGRKKGGRTRPPTQVVTAQRRPWGLIAGAVAVVVFAGAVITYAVVAVNRANEGRIEAIDELEGVQILDYAAGQEHVTTPVTYEQSPPVGGPHDPNWADCTGTVYDVDIRHENAVHSLEHGAVWITYDPERVSGADVETLAALVEGESGRMLSPYAGLDSPISIQSWNHQLKVDSADDPRLAQFADFLTYRSGFFPEPGASCENPAFAADPVLAGEPSEDIGPSDAETTPSAEASETPAR
ncbi:DUF3105 domain-containing protein [Geodermatophilus sp. YIM 151500]|uniref:DUF3105 domain-containing protein n=1 Tax=Geodermatophilus sp. YIM 151500 TaxID=2984531 RepID=UPI0021E375BF|nr:DUF3105 domain-containing protein [Geodermatophilus sp. YIM 151500]MCV2488749.1 DUF3105 domain-containing protein [Geodermatophilus sp. YIM 151500]